MTLHIIFLKKINPGAWYFRKIVSFPVVQTCRLVTLRWKKKKSRHLGLHPRYTTLDILFRTDPFTTLSLKSANFEWSPKEDKALQLVQPSVFCRLDLLKSNSIFFFSLHVGKALLSHGTVIIFLNCDVEYSNTLKWFRKHWHIFRKQVPLSEFSLLPPSVLSYRTFIRWSCLVSLSHSQSFCCKNMFLNN